jgi:hypothetical protein
MVHQVWNSFVALFLVLACHEISPVSALAPRASRIFLTKRIRQKLEQRTFSVEEKMKFVPVHRVSAIETQSCTAAPKTGFWFVGCYVDKDPDSLRMYDEETDDAGRKKPMTPEKCFEFCQFHKQMRYFFLKNGRDCSCARYYHKGSTGGLGGCTLPCTGDNSKFCGGKNKESVYQMHDCNAVAYVPTDPNEAMNLATELTKNGVKFYVKDREIGALGVSGNSTTGETEITTAYGGLFKGLSVIVLDAHNGNLMAERTFMIDGLVPGKGSFKHDIMLAHSEGAAMRAW